MWTHWPSFNYLLELHGATLSIGEQLGLAATSVHSKLFFILSEQTQNIEGFFVLQEMELCQNVSFKI